MKALLDPDQEWGHDQEDQASPQQAGKPGPKAQGLDHGQSHVVDDGAQDQGKSGGERSGDYAFAGVFACHAARWVIHVSTIPSIFLEPIHHRCRNSQN